MVQFKAKKGAPKDFKNPKHLKKSLVKSAAPQESIPNENETLLLTEIKALGGDESDLKLIKDSRSDSEFEEEEIKSEDKSLVNDLQAFMTGELKMKISAPQKSKTKPERNAEKSLGLNKAINDKKMEKKSVENKDLSSKKDSTRVSPKDSKKNKAKEVDNKPKAKEPLKLTAEDYKIPEFKIANAKKMTVEPQSQWYAASLPELDATQVPTANHPKIALLQKKAQELWEGDVKTYASNKKMTASDKEFVSTILKSGTVSDKVSALTLLVQESGLHQFQLLKDSLFTGMAMKKSRREAIMAMDSIKDLLIGSLLPDRKLKYFCDQPLLDKNVTSQHLITWYFEDVLKRFYFEFIQLLEQMSMDPLLFTKMKMLTYIYDLLRSKCESEQNLLTLMVNKMGDLEKKVASKASYLLSQLLIEHPAMKGVVIKEVERFLFRSNILERAQYYSINFLNQMVLTNRPEDVAVANYLVQLYFTLFEGLVVTAKESRATADNKKKPKNKKLKKKQAKKVLVQSSVDGMNAKMMAGLLTGVNRAFPYSKMEDEVFEEHMNTLFEICHIGTFHTCIQSLALIFQVQSNRQSLSDRFYRTLYEVLLDSRLASSSKQAVFMNLLFKSLKSDVSMPRTAAFVKRLIQVCAQSQVPFTCASLYLIGEVVKAKPGLKVLLNSPENDDGEEHFVDVDDGEDADDAQESNSVSILGKDVEENPTITEYDGKKREPLFAKADHVCLWDLVPFSRHFHPTVSLYAQKLIVGAEIPTPKDGSNYDPLRNHTLTLFLDRFVYKNPKKEVAKHSGSSLMQPHQNKKAFQQEQPMNLVDWTHKTETEIAADELFFVQYFKEKSKQEGKGKKKSKGDDDDDEDALLGGLGSGSEAGEDMDDEFTWDAMQNSSGFPSELKEDGDDDEPLTFEDLDGSEAEEDLDINQDDEDVDQEALAAQFAEMDGLDASLDDDALETPSDDGEGDADMAAFLQDEVSSDEEEENSKPSKGKSPLGKKKRGKLAKLAEQAKAKGYRGCFFEAAGGKSDFADADEFMDLMDRDMASAQESDVEEAEVTPGKKRDAPRGFPSKGKKKARRS